jgi:hypothetical protein
MADGSAETDAHDRVEIDRSNAAERWRYTCPRGHTRWSPTNSHAWCAGCRQENENGADVDPEHYELLDQKTGETIPYSAVDLAEPARPRMPRK